MGKLMEDKGRFSKVCLCRLQLVLSPVLKVISGDRVILLFLVWEREMSLQIEIYALPLDRKGEGREFLLCLLFLNGLQLKIILMPKWHTLGWYILIPFAEACFIL